MESFSIKIGDELWFHDELYIVREFDLRGKIVAYSETDPYNVICLTKREVYDLQRQKL